MTWTSSASAVCDCPELAQGRVGEASDADSVGDTETKRARASYDVLAIWRAQVVAARGHALDCGHFLAEERPAETTAELASFLEQC
jgi:pimeloyl-ACP methyl ester carboxylesterase